MIDLHLHLDGSLSVSDVIDFAKRSSVTLPTMDEKELVSLLRVDGSCTSLTDYLTKFDLPLSVLQVEETITLAVKNLLVRLKEQGLLYVEIRFAPQLHTRRGLSQEQIVCSAIAGLEENAQLILCCMRHGSREENEETVRIAKKYLGKGVCGIDLAGDESQYPTENFASLFELANLLQVPSVIHAGEAAGVKSVADSLSFGAKRIGHGIALNEDRSLFDRMKGIAIECCFTSNLQTNGATRETHPVKSFYESGLDVCICTDNMTVSGVTLKDEYKKIMEWGDFSIDTMKDFACTTARYTFLPKEKQDKLIETIQKNFDKWIKN